MTRRGWVGGLLIVFTLGLALVLTLLPLPAAVAAARPAFYPATVLFWVLAQRFGLVGAWCCGVPVDVLYGTPLAEHGLALAAAAYWVIKLQKPLARWPPAPQALLMTPAFAVYALVLFWIDGAAGIAVEPWWRWLPVAASGVLWPFWAALLKRLGQRPRR